MINWGIIGTGFMANMFAEDFEYVKGGKLMGVASRNLDRAQEFSSKYNIPNHYEGYKNLAKNKDIDVIYITTPHAMHYENMLMCFEHNKHVVCEKPITVNTSQLDELIHIAKEKDLFLMEALWTYFLPAIIMAKKWCDDKKIGDIQLIQATFGNNAKPKEGHRLYRPELAGGALLDLGIYTVALAQLIMDCSLEKVSADGYVGKSGVDENNAAILKYKSGTLAVLTSSITSSLKNDAYIYGTEGYIHIPDFYKAKNAYLYVDGEEDTYEDDRESKGFHYEAEEVNKLIKAGEKESQKITHQKSLCNLCTMDTIRQRLKINFPFEKEEV